MDRPFDTYDPANVTITGGTISDVLSINNRFTIIASLLADTTLTYTVGSATSVAAGDYIEAQGFRYKVADSAVTDSHVTTAGGVKLYVQAGDGGSYDVRAFGVIGDLVVDDTVALNAAAAAAKADGAFLTSSKLSCLITGTVTLNCTGDLSLMTVYADATSVNTAVFLGNSSGTGVDALYRYSIKLPEIINTAKTSAGWVGFDTSSGVKIGNLYSSNIVLKRVYGFGYGLNCGGYSAGFVYNEIVLGDLVDNKVCVRVAPLGPGGWANENNFYGGRLSHSSAEGVAAPGVKAIELANTYANSIGTPNNNCFIKPSVEGDPPEFHFDIQGSFNTFINPRCEIPAGTGVRINFNSSQAGETNSNVWFGGYKIAPQVVTNSGGFIGLYNKWVGSRNSDAMEYTNSGISFVNQSGNGSSSPHIQGFMAGEQAIGKTQTSTEWVYRLHADGFSAKNASSAYPRIELTSGGFLKLGTGTVAADAYITGTSGTLRAWANFIPNTASGYSLGYSNYPWSDIFADQITVGSAVIRSGTGTPEGVVSAVVGSLYTRLDGGAGTTLYVKESGTGATGWVAK